MATAGEGSYGGGGAGGKFRKRPFRRPQTTPYDRPPTALRNPSNGWLSKLVDPASRLITAGAHRFFSSVLRKRLPPPPPPPSPPPQPIQHEANQESRDMLQEAAPTYSNLPMKNPPGAQEPAINGGNTSNSCDNGGFTELEQILMQKTFTRSEIDRLTELLRSRSVDFPVGDEDKRSEANLSKQVAAHDRQEKYANSPVQENGIESHRLLGVISTPVVISRVIEEDVATPAELAKAYMGSRPSKVSPSMLSLHGQAFREDANLLSNLPFPAKSPIMSVAPKRAVHVGVPDNGFMTPRSRGRSAIYNMARTPYSRVHPTATHKGAGSTIDGYGGLSSPSQRAWEQNELSASKQVALKRRSSVFDDDIGSVGPIRRIRQKPNLLSSKNLSLPVSGSPFSMRETGVGWDAAQFPLSSMQKPLLLDKPKHKISKGPAENGDNSIPGTSFTSVPSQSSQMAAKILQHLDKLIPSPKEKSSELRLAAAREKSPTKLTPNMLSGQALKSLENVDSSKFVQNVQDNNKLDGSRDTCLPDARDSTSQKQAKDDENGPTKYIVPCDRLSPAVNGVDTAVSIKDTVPSVKTADSAFMNFVAHPPQKKRAFRMSAHEDYLELDDDGYSNGAASTPLAEGREKPDISVLESKATAAETVMVEKSLALSEVKLPENSILNKRTDMETAAWSVVAEKNTGFTFSGAPTSSMTAQPTVLAPESTLAFDQVVPPKEPYAAPPLFSFGSKNLDKVPPITFSSSSSVSESSGSKSGAWSDSKLESSSSFATVAAGATDAVLKIPESDKDGNKNTQKAGDVFRKPETASSSSVSTSTSTTSSFSFGAPANNSSLNNGSLTSSPFTFSSPTPVLVSNNLTNQFFSNSSSLPASTTTTTTTTTTTIAAAAAATAASSSSSISTSAAIPSSPIFKFESPMVPSTSVAPVSAISGGESRDLEAKTKQETPFGNLTSTFGGTSSAIASTGSSIFGFSASATSSSANNQSQGSNPFGTGSGSLFSAQASPAGTRVATFTQSIPIQSGSSASSPIFGSTGTTSFTSGGSLFTSSTPAAKLFGSSTNFGPSSSASSSEANAISSSSGTTSSLFGSSWQSTKSPMFGSSPSTGFSFRSSSASVVATNSAPMPFGSSIDASSGSVFSFTSAASTAPSLPSLSPPSQPVFGNPNPVFPFGSAASGNNDQMNMEDSMAEDSLQASAPAVPVFGQPPISPSPSGFMFDSTAPSGALSFPFSGQQSQATPQNPSPFQASGSLDFNAGGSFSLGTGGGDKSNRKIVRVKHKQRRK